MRKVLVVLAVLVFQGVAFSNEINVKAGIDSFRRGSASVKDYNSSVKIKEVGFSLAAEYLGSINDFVKVGIGLEYVLPKSIKYGEDLKSKLQKATKELPKELKELVEEMSEEPEKGQKANVSEPELSYMPIYVSIKVKPIPAFFLKGNLGYSSFLMVYLKRSFIRQNRTTHLADCIML